MSDFDDEIAELWAQVQELKAQLAPPDPAAVLRVPDIVEFVTSPEYLGMDLVYPDQMLVLKLHFLQIELLTAEGRATLARWGHGFSPPVPDPNHPVPHWTGEHGMCADMLERIDEMICAKRAVAEEILGGSAAEKALTEMNNEELLKFVSLDLSRAAE